MPEAMASFVSLRIKRLKEKAFFPFVKTEQGD